MIDFSVSNGLCTLRLDAPPVNAISLALLAALRVAVARANAMPDVRAMVITGGPTHFCAGADVALFQGLRSGDDAVRLSRVFQEAFQEIEDSPKPVAAAVAGNVLGGALELAMACHWRLAAAGSRFSLPEIRLGINPGAGGTQRLTRLVGPQAALEMLLGGQAINDAKAVALGLIDAVAPGETLLERCQEWLAAGPVVRRASQCVDKVSDPTANAAAIAAASQRAQTGFRPGLLAPRTIVEAVRRGLHESFAAGLVAEQEGFRDCMATLPAQNKIYVFTASRLAAKSPNVGGTLRVPQERHGTRSVPDTVPPVRAAAVVGMGTMGTGIAQALITAGIPTAAFDENPAAIQRGGEKIRASLAGRVSQGKLAAGRAEEILARLTLASDRMALAAADLIIEAVYEDPVVKQSALTAIELACSPEAIIATNTSTISLDVLAAGMQRPERLLGLHFFNPAHRMPLLEVIRRKNSPPELVAAAVQVGKRLGKTSVIVNNREGFLVNRLFIPYLKEAFWLLEEGAEPEAVDRAMVDFGFPMGPFVLIDMAGIDILSHTDAVLRRAFPWHGGPAAIVERLVQAGRLGQKTGAGVYRYEQGDRTPLGDPATTAMIADARRQRGTGNVGGTLRVPQQRDGTRSVPDTMPWSDEAICRRLVLRMVAEACHVLDEGVAQRPSDLDVAMVLGAGLDDSRGGLIKYASDRGWPAVIADLEALAAECGERYAPVPAIRSTIEKTKFTL